MLLGVAGLLRGDWRRIDSSIVQRVRDHGFSVVQFRVDDPGGVTDREIERAKGLIRSGGLVMGQTVGNYGGGLVSADEAVRGATIKFVKRMCNLSGKLGAPNTYFRPGSLNPNGAWLPHPDNRSPEVFDRLVDSAREICRVAQNEGVKLAVEGGVVSPLYSARRTREFFDAVGSKALGFNMDPVNYIGSLDDAYETTALLNEFYELLGGVIVGAHAKDFTIVDGLLPCFKEEIIGQGMLDQETFLSGMQRVCPDAHILIEHLPDDQIPAAAEGLRAAAERAGVRWGGVAAEAAR